LSKFSRVCFADQPRETDDFREHRELAWLAHPGFIAIIERDTLVSEPPMKTEMKTMILRTTIREVGRAVRQLLLILGDESDEIGSIVGGRVINRSLIETLLCQP
jgi:hypothetical protein